MAFLYHYVKAFSDMFVKYLFCSDGNEFILLSFVNSVLSYAGFPTIVKIVKRDPFNVSQFKGDKMSVVDISVVDENGHYYNIEIQSSYEKDYKVRSLYYWARLYSSQLDEGKNYSLLKPVISINLLNFSLIKENNHYHNYFRIVNNHDKDLLLTDHLSLHYVELPKFLEPFPKTSLGNWLYFFKHEGKGDVNMDHILESDEVFRKAHECYENFTQNREFLRIYDNRMKYLRALSSAKEEGREEGEQLGLKKGREEGERKAKIDLAKKMLTRGEDYEYIADLTGLSVEEVEQLEL